MKNQDHIYPGKRSQNTNSKDLGGDKSGDRLRKNTNSKSQINLQELNQTQNDLKKLYTTFDEKSKKFDDLKRIFIEKIQQMEDKLQLSKAEKRDS